MRFKKTKFLLIICWILLVSPGACVRSTRSEIEPWRPSVGASTLVPEPTSIGELIVPSPRAPGDPIYTPTPDNPHPLPGLRSDEEQYIVQAGDTLGLISQRFNVSIAEIAEANQIADINILEIGQVLVIPAPQPTVTGPGFKIIPDSELIASPATAQFNLPDFVYSQNGYLVRYQEEVNEQTLAGFQIVQEVARDFSVNPRILLAVLEYQSGWVTNPNPRTDTLKYPVGWKDPWREGLYKQLAWAADNLNRGYYLWRANAAASWILADNTLVPIEPTINAGTASIQHFFGLLYGYKTWEKTITEEGFFAVYNELFGYPFDHTYEPIIPENLSQPAMQLPFEDGVVWAFTGGPHGGWGDGSAWASLDFAPFVDTRGCFASEEWVVAMADGLIVRAEDGAVVQDLDSDGKEQTGWTILYMHIESRDRVQEGTFLKAGERIGHPSCEGGFTDGTHAHVARRYNGEWIPADQDLPFIMGGWTSSGTGDVYDGYLQKGDTVIEAYNGNIPGNAIQR
jgi:murein DD-endopeptidase MepM/ murein hydrolase activator NlpD